MEEKEQKKAIKAMEKMVDKIIEKDAPLLKRLAKK